MTLLGHPRVHVRSLGSTNDRARTLALAGAPHGTAVTADEQLSGRGRRGRSWTTVPGKGLALSLVLRDLEEPELVPLAAGVAVAETLAGALPGPGDDGRVTVKWPNDVWIEERKAAGILVEARAPESWIVLGVGVNVGGGAEDLPTEARDTATSLEQAGGDGDRVRLLAMLLDALSQRLAEPASAVLTAWRERDALTGREITWDGGAGRAEGVDEAGRLIVDGPGGREALSAGEVQLVRPGA